MKEMALRRWIDGDESAKEMLDRVFMERPFLLFPPLHRVPLRVGNVVEIVGPSPAAKTHILMEAAVSCILPREWNGVHYGGWNHLVMFVDLDCRFDILRLSEMLKHRIMKAHESTNLTGYELKDAEMSYMDKQGDSNIAYSETLYALCMSRFLYVRCSNSFEFLATLKTMGLRLQKEKEIHDLSVSLLMIDSIGAFHWVDRPSMFLPIKDNNRKTLFLQRVSEIVVQEIKKLLRVHPMLVMATKSTISGDKFSMVSNEVKGKFLVSGLPDARYSRNLMGKSQQLLYREYMSSVWQSFVTHRIFIRASDSNLTSNNHQSSLFYLLEWLLPTLNSIDKFVVNDAGISMIS